MVIYIYNLILSHLFLNIKHSSSLMKHFLGAWIFINLPSLAFLGT